MSNIIEKLDNLLRALGIIFIIIIFVEIVSYVSSWSNDGVPTMTGHPAPRLDLIYYEDFSANTNYFYEFNKFLWFTNKSGLQPRNLCLPYDSSEDIIDASSEFQRLRILCIRNNTIIAGFILDDKINRQTSRYEFTLRHVLTLEELDYAYREIDYAYEIN